MALTDSQKTSALDKKSLGKSSTDTTRDFFEEPYNGRAAVLPSQVWMEAADIPTTAPVLAADAISGVVQYKEDLALTAVPGTSDAFYHADLVDAIPFNFGDGSYNYVLKDSGASNIPFGTNDWRLDPDTGVVYFYGGAPANMPPTVSFYKYVGEKGVGGAGGGSGDGSKNYFGPLDAKLEDDIGQWETDDGAGSASGGLTLSVTTTSGEVLEGLQSLKLVKDAADRDGHFIKVPLKTIDLIDQGNELSGSFAFKDVSGYIDGDLIVELYDNTNTDVLSTIPVDINAGKGVVPFRTQLLSDTDDIEFRIKVNNTNTNTFTVVFDEFKFGPDGFATVTKGLVWRDSGLVAGDFAGFGTVTNINVRHAVSAEGVYYVKGNFTTGSTTASEGRMNLASGYTISSDVARQPVGITVRPGDTDSYTLVAVGGNSYFNFGGGTAKQGDSNGNFMGNSEVCYLEGSVEVDEKPVPQILNDYELSLQTIKAKASGTTQTTLLNNAYSQVKFSTIEDDEFGVLDSNGAFTARGPGDLTINTFVKTGNTSSITSGEDFRIAIFINDVKHKDIYEHESRVSGGTSYYAGGNSIEVPVVKNDVVTVRAFQQVGNSVSSSVVWVNYRMEPNFKMYGAIKNNEVIESNQANTSYGGTTGQWYDQDFLDLPPGEWDLFVIAVGEQGATPVDISVGISTTSGNTSPGSEGLDFSSMSISVSLGKTSTTHFNKPGVIVNSLTRYYLKTLVSAAGASLGYRYYARRVR